MTSNFWLLEARKGQPLAEEAPDCGYMTITCPIHKRAKRTMGGLSIIVHPLGMKDFTWTWNGDVLVSLRALRVFEKRRVTGFEARPAKVCYPETIKQRPPDLFELVVTGWGGLAAPASGVTLTSFCLTCGHRQYRIAEPSRLIDPAAWDGSDLFIVWPLPRYHFASKRLASILRQEGVSGVEFISAPEIPVERGASVSPGTLSLSMPEHRARELEERFGVSHWLVRK